MKFYFRYIIILCGFIIAISNVVLGVTLLPEVNRISMNINNKFVPLIVSLGILLQSFLTIFLTLYFGFKDEELK